MSLKHLSLELGGINDGELLQPLRFPILEVLKLYETESIFPSWMAVSSSLKLETFCIYRRLPSISELFVENEFYVEEVARLTDRCPSLQILHFSKRLLAYTDSIRHAEFIKLLLEGRRDNVAAGLEVEGVKMESLKRLFVPFDECE